MKKIHLNLINNFNFYRFLLPLLINFFLIYYFKINTVSAEDVKVIVKGHLIGVKPDIIYNLPLDGWV